MFLLQEIFYNLYNNSLLFVNAIFNRSSSSLLDLYRYGFSEPANHAMRGIIEMYYTTAQIMTYIFICIIVIIWAIVSLRNQEMQSPINFKRWQETIIDIGVLFIPLIIIYSLTIPAIGYILHMDRYLQDTTALFNIEVTAHQWYWQYHLDCLQNPIFLEVYYIYHPNIISINEHLMDTMYAYSFEFDSIMDIDATEDLKYLLTTKALVLPVNTVVKFLITSEDVIHSFTLPQLGIKIDSIPGRIQIFLFISNNCGVFFGQCSELCGVNHAFMPIQIEVVEDIIFFDWYLKHLEIRPYFYILDDAFGTLEDLLDIIPEDVFDEVFDNKDDEVVEFGSFEFINLNPEYLLGPEQPS